MDMEKEEAFTIIEMLIVLSIIGALALISMPFVIRARFKADYTACLSNERNLAQALELVKNSEGRYPEKLKRVVTSGHMLKLPVCPSNRHSYAETYEVTDNGDRYTIWCPGIHYKFLKYLKPGYPVYSSVYGLNLGEKKE